MSVGDFFDRVADMVVGFPNLVKGVTEITEDFVNDVKVTTSDFKKDMKSFSREVSVDIANNINPDLGNTVETLHGVEDKVSEKIKNFGSTLNNPAARGTAVKSSNDLYTGDHIYISRGYTHHGIYVGDDEVIHFAIESGDICIHSVSFDKFADGQTVFKMNKMDSPTRYSGSEVAERARQKLYEQSYNLLFNNCEHFARWCRFGEE